MALPITCPGCQSAYSVGDNLVGKTIRCKKCGELIEVTAPAKAKPAVAATAARPAKPAARPSRPLDDDRPAKPSRRSVAAFDEDEDDDRPVRKGKGKPAAKSKLPLILAGVVGLLLLGGGGAFLAFSGKDNDKADDTKTVAQTNPTDDGGRGKGTPKADEVPPVKGNEIAKPAVPKVDGGPVPTARKPADEGKVTKADANPGTVSNDAVPSALAPASSDVKMAMDRYMAGQMDPLTTEAAVRRTVMISITDWTGLSGGYGTGWFGLEKNIVITNAHVLHMDHKGAKPPQKITFYLNSGTPDQRAIPHAKIKLLAVDPEIDLAVLEVQGEKDLPAPFPVRPSANLQRGQGVKVIGFPLAYKPGKVADRQSEPEASVRPTTVSALRKNEHNQLRMVQLEGGVSSGNSGGPIVDAEGYVIGVVVAALIGSQGVVDYGLSLGIPTEYVTGLLTGRIGSVEYGQPYRDTGKVKVPVTAKCLDPFGRLAKVGVRGWVGNTTDKPRPPGPKPADKGPSDADVTQIELKYNATTKEATGELTLSEPPVGRTFWAQPFYSSNAAGDYWLPGNLIPTDGPPVDRVPTELIYRPQPGIPRTLELSVSSGIAEVEDGNDIDLKRAVTQIERRLRMTESVQPKDRQDTLAAARLKLDFSELSLVTKEGKEDQPVGREITNLFNRFIKQAGAVARVARSGEIIEVKTNALALQGIDPELAKVTQVLGDQILESLKATSIPLPGGNTAPLHTWTARKNYVLTYGFLASATGLNKPPQVKAKTVKFVQEMTYKYVGLRERAGRREAVIEITGRIAPGPGMKPGSAGGEMKGRALVELSTGVVSDATLDSELQVDVSGEGQVKKLIGFDRYKLSRGAAVVAR